MGLVCLLIAPLCVHAQTPPSDVLRDAEDAFRQQQYRQAEGLLRPLLYPEPSLREVDTIHHARELLGASHWHLEELELARQEFQFLLIARPALRLDPLVYPGPLRSFFEELRAHLVAQGVIEDTTESLVDTQPAPPPSIMRIDRTIERRSRALAFMPFGVPQFEYGEEGWGYFFATSQGVAALTSIGTFMAATILNYDTAGRAPTAEEESLHASLVLTSIISGAAFYGLATWGIIDANVRHEPLHVVRTTRTLETRKTADIRVPQPHTLVTAPTAGGSPR